MAMITEWVGIKIAGTVAGAVGAYAAIVARKDVNKFEAYAIALVGVTCSIFIPSLIASKIILRYNMVNDFETLFGIVGLLGLISGYVGYKIIVGLGKIASLFERSPIPFIQKLLGVFGGGKP